MSVNNTCYVPGSDKSLHITGIIVTDGGKIPTSYLSGTLIDQVVEGYYHDGKMYSDSAFKNVIKVQANTFYVDVDTNRIYRASDTSDTPSVQTVVEIHAALPVDLNQSDAAYSFSRGKVDHDNIRTLESNVSTLQASQSDLLSTYTTLSNTIQQITKATSTSTYAAQVAKQATAIGFNPGSAAEYAQGTTVAFTGDAQLVDATSMMQFYTAGKTATATLTLAGTSDHSFQGDAYYANAKGLITRANVARMFKTASDQSTADLAENGLLFDSTPYVLSSAIHHTTDRTTKAQTYYYSNSIANVVCIQGTIDGSPITTTYIKKGTDFEIGTLIPNTVDNQLSYALTVSAPGYADVTLEGTVTI